MSTKVFFNNVSRGTQQLGKALLLWLLPILLIAIWQIASSSGLLQSRVLPTPTAVVSTFWQLLISGELWQHVRVSAGETGRCLCTTAGTLFITLAFRLSKIKELKSTHLYQKDGFLAELKFLVKLKCPMNLNKQLVTKTKNMEFLLN